MFFRKKPGFYSSNLDNYIAHVKNGDLRYLSWIFCTFAEDSAPHKLRAAKVLKEVLDDFSFDDIYRTDRQMRETTSMEWSINWHSLNINNFITGGMLDEDKYAVLVFSSFNPNGYIREQAVKNLGEYKGSLPFIFLRCNDWVCQVRQTAFQILPTKLERASDKEIIECLPIMEKLYRGGRCEYSELLSTMVHVFEADSDLVKKGLASGEVKARKFCLSIVNNIDVVKNEYLFNHINNESDPFLRKMVFQILLKRNADMEEVSRYFLRDKYPPNRMLALQFLYENKTDAGVAIAENMLTDNNARVRLLAREILQENQEDFDFRHHYLDALSVKTAVSIYGLGEVGGREDCKLIEKFLSDGTPSVVRAAMTALMCLDSEKYISDITEMLAKDHPGIVKTATLLLKKSGSYDFEKILEICNHTKSENTKIKCATLLFSGGKWKSLIYTLMLIGSGYEKLENLCQMQIYKWIFSYNRFFAALSEVDKRTINMLINEKKEFLKPNDIKEIRFLVR